MERKMKGQYFLISGIILTTLFYIGFYLTNTSSLLTLSFESDDMKYILYNVEDEYPRVFNFGINDSDITGYLSDYTLFTKDTLSGNLINFTSLWIYTINESDDLNITAGNFLGYDTIVSINISGTVRNISVGNEDTNSTLFPSPGESFNVTVSFNTNEKKLSMLRDKYNIYAYMQLKRMDEIVKGGIQA